MRYVFIHVPKTAGTSLVHAFIKLFGDQYVLQRYPDQNPVRTWWQKMYRRLSLFVREYVWMYRFIVGHVPVTDYLRRMPDGSFQKRHNDVYMIFLRNPLERAISHYYYWQQISDTRNKLWNDFQENKPTVEDFLLNPIYANFHTRYLKEYPIEAFDFVGISEEYDKSILLLRRMFPELHNLEVLHYNSTAVKDDSKIKQLSQSVINQFCEMNREDYRLYERGREWFRCQAEKYLDE